MTSPPTININTGPPDMTSPRSDYSTVITADSVSSVSDSPVTPISLQKDMINDVCFVDLSPNRSDLSPIRRRFQDHQKLGINNDLNIRIPSTDNQLDIDIDKKQLYHVGLFYKVYQTSARRLSNSKSILVAIKKLINPTQASDIVIKEARILSILSSHRNIIDFFGLYDDSSLVSPWYSLTLGSYVFETPYDSQDGQQPWVGLDRWIMWSQQLLSALDFIHSNNIIHCDIKPDNILLDETLSPMLADFSSAQFIDENTNSIAPTLLSGASAIEYTAPELLRTKSTRPSASTDVFSLGTVMLYAATGNAPYHTANKNAVQKLIWAQQGVALDYGTDEDNKRCSKIRKILHGWLVDRCDSDELMEMISEIRNDKG